MGKQSGVVAVTAVTPAQIAAFWTEGEKGKGRNKMAVHWKGRMLVSGFL